MSPLAWPDFTLLQNSCQRENDTDKTIHDRNKTVDNTDLKQKLKNLGLGDVDIDGCQVSPSTKSQLVDMLEQYHDVFSKHHLDCGEAKGFVYIFVDLNFSTLLCYLDDFLVFAPSEQEALNRLEAAFQRLREHNLKLSPKKCHLLQRSVKSLGHIIDGDGVAVDPGKVEVIVRMTKKDLMEDDSHTPSVRRVKSFLGMIFYYQHFIPNCSSISKPLFALTAGQKQRGKTSKSNQRPGVFKLKPADWTDDCDPAFLSLKEKLLNCVACLTKHL